jgi:hypothetical protein
MKSLREIFPKGSRTFFERNAATMSQPADKSDSLSAKLRGVGGFRTKTEREFAVLLEHMKRTDEILRYDYEGITLRWQSGHQIIRYTPDFVVFPPAIAVSGQIKFIEVKGPFIKGKFERAIERFRHARTYWPQFLFELHQKTKDGWRRIL